MKHFGLTVQSMQANGGFDHSAHMHLTRRALTSNWFINSFIMIAYEKIVLKFSQNFLSK